MMRPRQVRRRVAATAAGIVLTATGIGWATEAAATPSICGSLAVQPTVGTVENLVVALINDGWTAEESGEIIAATVYQGCPQFGEVLDRFISAWVDPPVSAGVGGRVIA